MDEIETGFSKIIKKIEEGKDKITGTSDLIKANDAMLLERMAEKAIPVVKSIGITLLQKGKQDTKGELYDTRYYEKKMIILGKTDPVQFRPDNPAKKVTDQFCLLSEEGKFYEIMYSSDELVTDSYLNVLDVKTVLELYGYDPIYMLYKAMHDYLKGEEALIAALDATLAFIFAEKQQS
ncbi:MAG: hypothetical protein A4E35_00189 [Methanoregula sp. PtaU1.Bin051]|nr:MAG: hypothetical protein A4E35_00189 [Methanoregula sp. PtaU1.Bin051]